MAPNAPTLTAVGPATPATLPVVFTPSATGAPATGYTVVWVPPGGSPSSSSSASATGSGSPIALTAAQISALIQAGQLQNGQTYDFYVYALNGWGPSAASNKITWTVNLSVSPPPARPPDHLLPHVHACTHNSPAYLCLLSPGC